MATQVKKMIGAVDIGGTKIAVGGVTAGGVVVQRHEILTEPARGFENAMLRVRQLLRKVASECGGLAGIGIACPSPLDAATGIIGEVGTLPGWQGKDLIRALHMEFDVPVAIENDADAAALAEANWGAAKGGRRFIYVTVSTGIGGGIVLDGKLYRGAGNSHPELGHQIIDLSGPRCYCGAKGCWEILASGSSMSTWMHEQQPELPEMTAETICTLAKQGNPLALATVQREGYYLGVGLANIVTLFTPDLIALGGGVMKGSRLFLGDALKVVRELCTQVPAEKTRIVLASLGNDVGLLGAAQAWQTRYQQQSAS